MCPSLSINGSDKQFIEVRNLNLTMTADPGVLSSAASSEPRWGRVLIAGGTDWTKLGRKERPGGQKVAFDAEQRPDLTEPHILRSLSNVKIKSIHAGSMAVHHVALDIDGMAWLFGRNSSSCLGIAGVDMVSENAPYRLTAHDLGAPPDTKFVHAACGRYHTLLVGSGGELWTAGSNVYGQCGHSVCPEISSFKRVDMPDEQLVSKATAGISFSAVLTTSGRVYTFGSSEKGQLGNGVTGERITTGNKTAFDIEDHPILVKDLEDVVQISAGQQHCLALDSTGRVYVWGFNGYSRLGLGSTADVLRPKVVPQFSGPIKATMGALVVAGPANSVVVDNQGMYYMAGKWKNTGEGSSGAPYSTFRFMRDIMGCQVSHVACGGVTHFALAPDDADENVPMTIVFGQAAANGELGLGADEVKSATKPTKNVPLSGVDVFQIAAGQHSTLFLARPSDKLSDLPRHPVGIGAPEACCVCHREDGEDAETLQCDKCDSPYHLQCLKPPLSAVPDGEWFCPQCALAPGAPIGGDLPVAASPKKAAKRAPPPKKREHYSEEEDEEAEDSDDEPIRGKRKTSGRKGSASKRRKA
ncbi:RCC1/BLIP-II protein [Fistulina hepatica ATCC 64428]|uniref:RCC1/BLIP-II protein n=1 Tax=Fistulina hepatica ATCC 64428 TaxID=1128425 RepID=A0A0D7A8X9_9AGAR|nr:RCC1/BLIP-II protein [Fistulina hepatica ATCC 64428]